MLSGDFEFWIDLVGPKLSEVSRNFSWKYICVSAFSNNCTITIGTPHDNFYWTRKKTDAIDTSW